MQHKKKATNMNTQDEIAKKYRILVEHFKDYLALVDIEHKRLQKGINDITDYLTFFHNLRTQHDELDEMRKSVYHMKDSYDKGVIPAKFEEMDVDKLSVPSIGKTFSILNKHSASLLDKTEGYKWLRENGYSELITETVNASSLASAMSDMILNEGKEPPAEIIKFSSYKTTSVLKYTPKKGK